jgi:HK97 family phage portal protein
VSKYEIIRPRRQSLWDKVRSYTLGPLSLKDPEIRKYFQGGETSTGVSVSEYTALNYSGVWSAVKLVSGDVASQPLVLYRRVGNGKERYEAHPLYRLLHDQPNPEMSSLTFRQTLQAHALTWGNGYAEIERDTVGRPKYLWPLTPDRVHPDRDAGKLVYRVSNNSGRDTTLEAQDVLHIPGLGWDGTQGYGVIAKARESVALGIAAERFGGKFYGNGSTFGGTLTHPTKFSTPQARENFEKALRNRSQGVDRAHGLLLLEEGITYQQLGIPPDQAQFLESRQFQITEIARWFNVPPHKIGDLSRATFSNIEQQNIEYVQTTLIYWFEAWEQELMRKLISPLERNQQFIEHVVEGLLRGDSQGRAALQSAEFNIGALTPNESRALANRNSVPGGDRPFVPLSMIPLDRVDEYIDSIIKKNTTPKPAPSTPGTGGQRDVESVELVVRLETQRDEARAELVKAQATCAELVDDLTAAKVGQEGLRAEVAAEKGLRSALEEQAEALTEQLAVSASLLKDTEERLAIAATMIAERDAELVTVRSEREQWQAEADGLNRSAGVLSDRVAVLTAQLTTAEGERDEARTAQAHLAELLDGAQTALAAEQAERAEAARHAVSLVQRLDADIEAEKRTRACAEQERNDAKAKADELAGIIAERDVALADLRAIWEKDRDDLNRLTQSTLEAEAAKVGAEQRAEQAGLAKAAAEALLAERDTVLATRLNIEAQRVAAVLTSHRALIVDAMRRLLAKETDRARRHQATPQKLRAWLETFYVDHVNTVTEALRPILAADLAWRQSGADPAVAARAIADAQCREAQDQLRMVASVEDFHEALERTLQRWEVQRPEQVADKWMQEAVSHVRSL